MPTERFKEMQSLLDRSKFFKLVCGAGNENAEEVKRLTVLYTLAGAKGMDVSANVDVVKSCMEGIDYAFDIAKKFHAKLSTRPFITVSIGMPGDHHVRKAQIHSGICIKCRQCISVCPTSAISADLLIKREKCIGCGHCSAICPKDGAITFVHNEKALHDILPKCMKAGAEQIELHAAVPDEGSILDEWKLVNEINKNNHVSMCLDRLHLSNFALEERVKKAKKIAGERLVIQADGYPMSGGKNDFNTTLQAIATADVINKKFNMEIDRKTKTLVYKAKREVNILLSGGTNFLTSILAKQTNVSFQGVSLGTFARQLAKGPLNVNNFYNDIGAIKQGYLTAKKLVTANIGEINE
jgi:ferredoxin